MRRYTASRENEEMEAMFPVLKKADWRRKRENKEMRASAKVRARYFPARVTVVLAAGEEDKV